MAITVIASTIKQGIGASTPNTTSAINTTGATLIEISLTINNPNTVTISDSKGNTWIALQTVVSGSTFNYVQKYYAICSGAGKNGSSHTFTATGANAYCAIAVVAYAGTNLVFGSQSAGASTASATSLNSGSVTPSRSEGLITALLGFNGSPTSIGVSGGGLAIRHTQAFVGGTSYGLAIADEIQSTAAARNPAWSWTTASDGATYAAAYFEDVWPAPIEQARSVQFASSTSFALAFRRNVTAGNTLVVFATISQNTVSSISDSQGNTYTQQAFIGSPTISGGVYLWTATAASTASVTVTIATSGAGNGTAIGLMEIQTGYTYTALQTATGNSVGPAATSNITTLGSGIVVGLMGERNGGGTYTDPSGWSLVGESTSLTGVSQAYSFAYIIGSPGTYSPSWSWSPGGSRSWAVVAASFEGPAGAGATSSYERIARGVGRGVLRGAR